MRITGMSFEKKVLTSQWEHELLKVEVIMNEGEQNPGARCQELVGFVKSRGETEINVGTATMTRTVGNRQTGEATTESSSKSVHEGGAGPAAPAEGSGKKPGPKVGGKQNKSAAEKAAAATPAAEASASPSQESAAQTSEPEVKENAAAEAAASTSTPEPKVEEKKEAAKTESGSTVKVKKVVPYNRANETHKKLVGEFLDKTYGGWRASAQKYVDVSKKLEGQNLLDDEGMIIQSFKDTFDKELKALG